MMKKYRLITGLMLSFMASQLFAQPCSGNQADCWTLLGNNADLKVDIYYNKDIVAKSKDEKMTYILYDFFEGNNQFNKNHQSEIESVIFNCSLKKYQLIDVKWYTEKKGSGEVVFQTSNLDWEAVPKPSVYNEILNIVCQ
jgi:hypothetical protein